MYYYFEGEAKHFAGFLYQPEDKVMALLKSFDKQDVTIEIECVTNLGLTWAKLLIGNEKGKLIKIQSSYLGFKQV